MTTQVQQGVAGQATCARRPNADGDIVFMETYNTYYPRVLRFIYRRVSDVELAEDLAAETFMRAYTKGRDLWGAETCASWLFTVARNLIIDHYRKAERVTNGMRRVEESLRLSESANDPEERAVHNQTMQELRSHLCALSRREQELIGLKFQADLSYTEISQMLQMSVPNVRVAICRALKKLRAQVNQSSNWQAA